MSEEAVSEPLEEESTHPDENGEVEYEQDQPEEPDPNEEIRQREQAAIERFEKAAATFENAANRARNNPTDQNIQAAEKAKGKLDDLLESDDLDLDPSKGLKTVASEVKSQQQQTEDRYSQLERELVQYRQNMARMQDHLARTQLESEHPQLKGKYDEIKEAARKSTYEIVGDTDVSQDVLQRIFQKQWEVEVQSRVSNSGESKPQSTAKKPKATQPVKSRGGQERTPQQKSVADILFGDMTKNKG